MLLTKEKPSAWGEGNRTGNSLEKQGMKSDRSACAEGNKQRQVWSRGSQLQEITHLQLTLAFSPGLLTYRDKDGFCRPAKSYALHVELTWCIISPYSPYSNQQGVVAGVVASILVHNLPPGWMWCLQITAQKPARHHVVLPIGMYPTSGSPQVMLSWQWHTRQEQCKIAIPAAVPRFSQKLEKKMLLRIVPGKGRGIPLTLAAATKNAGLTGIELRSLVACPAFLHVLVLAGKVPPQTNDHP